MKARMLLLLMAICLGASPAWAIVNRDAPKFTPTIDGTITAAEMSGQLAIPMSWPFPDGFLAFAGAGSGVDDISATWYVSWDDTNLNMSAVVLDNTPDFQISSGGTGNVPYNAQDLIQPVFNPNNDQGHTFIDNQPPGEPFFEEEVAAIYDMVVNTSDEFGPDVYRHGVALDSTQHASITIEGQETATGYILEMSLPWAVAMDFEDASYIPQENDVHGLGFILVSFDDVRVGATPDHATLYTDFGEGLNTIGAPTTWNTVTLVAGAADADIDDDGDVDGQDYLAIQRTDPSLISQWESEYPGAVAVVNAVPEPISIMLFGLGSLLLVGHTRRSRS